MSDHEDERRCSDDSEYGSDEEECIDIVNGSSQAMTPSSEDQKEEGSCDGIPSSSNFSIDTILGLKSKDGDGNSDDEKVNSLKCIKESKFIKPTPLPAIPRGKHQCHSKKITETMVPFFMLIKYFHRLESICSSFQIFSLLKRCQFIVRQ